MNFKDNFERPPYDNITEVSVPYMNDNPDSDKFELQSYYNINYPHIYGSSYRYTIPDYLDKIGMDYNIETFSIKSPFKSVGDFFTKDIKNFFNKLLKNDKAKKASYICSCIIVILIILYIYAMMKRFF